MTRSDPPRLVGLTATALPAGNRIALTWRIEGPAGEPHGEEPPVRVLRRTGAHPALLPVPDDPGRREWVGDVVPGEIEVLPDGRRRVIDTGLQAEAVYYYRVLLLSPSGNPDPDSPVHEAAAMATGPYELADRLHALLPGIYRRYDTVLPRDLFGEEQLATMAPADRDRGQLRRYLGLVGGELDQLYSTIRALPGLVDLATVDGRLLPLLAHWIGWHVDNRLGFDDQRREIRDAPARYRAVQTVASVEAAALRITGWPVRSAELVDNVGVTNRPERLNLWLADASGVRLLSADEARSGRVAVLDGGATVRLFYATDRDGRSDLWEKVHDGTAWRPSAPVVTGRGTVRDPAAVLDPEGRLLLVWNAHDTERGWRIEFRDRTGAVRRFGDDDVERRDPAAAVDGSALWLFWRERHGGRWELRYARFPGPAWEPTPAGAHTFPLDGEADPRVESRVSPVVRLDAPRLGVVWAHRHRVGDQRTRWRLAARFTTGATTDAWGPVRQLDVDGSAGHAVDDRDPSAGPGGTVHFASTRAGAFSVWRVPLDAATVTWGAPQAVATSPAADREPVAFTLGGSAVVAFRSSRPVTYRSPTFPTTTVDRRYGGSVTLRATDPARAGLVGTVDDVAAYTGDCRPVGRRRVSPETVRLHLTTGSAPPATVAGGRDRLRAVLPDFLPATHDAVLTVTGSGDDAGDGNPS